LTFPTLSCLQSTFYAKVKLAYDIHKNGLPTCAQLEFTRAALPPGLQSIFGQPDFLSGLGFALKDLHFEDFRVRLLVAYGESCVTTVHHMLQHERVGVKNACSSRDIHIFLDCFNHISVLGSSLVFSTSRFHYTLYSS
jgi:hypothetical protein